MTHHDTEPRSGLHCGRALIAEAKATPTWYATRVLHATLRVLPRAARARYREELDSELSELTAAGRPRRSQLDYALRAAGRLW